jgi:nicotinate-nucleotide pyrophosphorylase (carboxylating)
MDELPNEDVRRAVLSALAEDLGEGDATTLATVSSGALANARMVARQPLVVAGLAFAEQAFAALAETGVSTGLKVERIAVEGERIGPGDLLLQVKGPARAILSAERVALNFVQHLSGVATLTALFVERIHGTKARILDTRKTTPGWRLFEKYAVRCGGGLNHRFGLFDMVLIKDNHLAALRDELPNPIDAAVRRARRRYPELRVEVEADRLDQVREAVEAGADRVLLDNMSLAELREAVAIVGGRAETEASGGVNLSTVRAIAESGVDFISVGALTHSAPAVDIGLDFLDL